jgi:hypothetical protein
MKLKLFQKPSTTKDSPNLKLHGKISSGFSRIENESFFKKPSSCTCFEATTTSTSRLDDFDTTFCEADHNKRRSENTLSQPESLMKDISDRLSQEVAEFVRQVDTFQEQSRTMIDVILDNVKTEVTRHFVHSPEVNLSDY